MIDSSVGTLRVACISDSAMDVSRMDTTKYVQTRDPSLVVELPGKRVTWFVLRQIPTSVFTRYVQQAPTEVERFERAFSVACERVEFVSEKLPMLGPTGEVQSAIGAVPRWTERDMDALSPAYVDEVGGVAWWRSFLAHEPAPLYPARALYLGVLATRTSRLAAEARTAATAQSNAAPSASRAKPRAKKGARRSNAPAKAHRKGGAAT